MDSHESHFPSGEKRGVLSAPLPVVNARDPPPSGPIRYTSTFVLSATVESPWKASAISLPSGATATSPSPLVAMVGTSWSTSVRSVACPLDRSTRNTCWRWPARQSSQWRQNRPVHSRASVGKSPFRLSISWSAGHLMSLTARNPPPLPSGSQYSSPTPSGRLLTRRASPPARLSTQICEPVWRVERNASV